MFEGGRRSDPQFHGIFTRWKFSTERILGATTSRTNPYGRVSHDGLVGSSEERFYYLLRTRPIPVRQPQLPITKKWSETSPLPPRDGSDNLLAQSNLLPASVAGLVACSDRATSRYCKPVASSLILQTMMPVQGIREEWGKGRGKEESRFPSSRLCYSRRDVYTIISRIRILERSLERSM